MSSRPKTFAACPLLALFFLAWVGACGRSSLDDYTAADAGPGTDASPDVGADVLARCDASICPDGCCDSSGACQPGTDVAACGALGARCADCPSRGFSICDAQAHACANSTTACGPASCPGCCGGNLCFGGSDANECGANGNVCLHCASQGLLCKAGQCAKPGCDASNCTGCCLGDQCLSGTDLTACGQNGRQCQNCKGVGETCRAMPPAGGVCVTQSRCGPQNCGGCCEGDACLAGTGANECGVQGKACQHCDSVGLECAAGQCTTLPCGPSNCGGCCFGNICVHSVVEDPTKCGNSGKQCEDCPREGGKCVEWPPNGPPFTATECLVKGCGPQNCPGCCDAAGACEPGFLDTACGQIGAACDDCQAKKLTCNTSAKPRVCAPGTTQCPRPYPACDATLTEPVLVPQKVCSSIELANSGAACAGGATTAACTSYFQFEQQTNPPCASCLAPFRDFQSGVLECIAPYVDASCRHALACVGDCEQQSCAQCDPAAVSACRSAVQSGQCQPFLQNAQCAGPALGGAAAFCDLSRYPNYGQWLQGVAGQFCAQ